jgi:hypothetical protein
VLKEAILDKSFNDIPHNVAFTAELEAAAVET